jgi:hypothetical protein
MNDRVILQSELPAFDINRRDLSTHFKKIDNKKAQFLANSKLNFKTYSRPDFVVCIGFEIVERGWGNRHYVKVREIAFVQIVKILTEFKRFSFLRRVRH